MAPLRWFPRFLFHPLNLTGYFGDDHFNGSYSGIEGDSPSWQMYLPSVAKQYLGWTSNLYIQNLKGDSVDIVIDLYDNQGARVCQGQEPEFENLPAHSSWFLDLSTLNCLPDGFWGSAIVYSYKPGGEGGPIMAVDNQTNNYLGAYGQTQTYNGFAVGASTFYCPALYADFLTWNSSLKVQRIGEQPSGEPIRVTATYSDGIIKECDLYFGAACMFYQQGEGHTENTFSAIVTSDHPGTDLVAVVSAANPTAQAQAYNCFLPTEASTTYYTPLAMKQFLGWNTGLQLQNVGNDNALVHVSYEGYSELSSQCTDPIAPGDTCIIYVGGESFLPPTDPSDPGCSPAGYTGSATVTSNQPIVMIVNHTNASRVCFESPTGGDWSASFNAVPFFTGP